MGQSALRLLLICDTMCNEKLESIGKRPYNGEELDEPRPLLEYQD